MSADKPGTPPERADSPPSGTDTSLGRPDLGPQRDEGTPATDVRTDVRTEAEVETVMRGEVDPETLVSPPRDDQGRFADKPGQIHAEGLADVPKGHPWNDPNTPLGRDALTVDAPLNVSPLVEPYLGNYRGYLDCYEFTQDTPVATGVASENTRYGNGGTPQMYVPDVRQLIADRKLKYVGSAQLEGTTAASWRVRRQ